MAKTKPTFSLSETAELIGVSRSTIERALRNGCPAVQVADRRKRREWQLEVGVVANWLIAEKVKKVEAEFTGHRGQMRAYRLRKDIAECLLAEEVALKRLESVVLVQDAAALAKENFDQIRAELMTVGGRCAARWRHGMRATEIQVLIDEEVRGATRRLARRKAA